MEQNLQPHLALKLAEVITSRVLIVIQFASSYPKRWYSVVIRKGQNRNFHDMHNNDHKRKRVVEKTLEIEYKFKYLTVLVYFTRRTIYVTSRTSKGQLCFIQRNNLQL